jgi:hypothetical protein
VLRVEHWVRDPAVAPVGEVTEDPVWIEFLFAPAIDGLVANAQIGSLSDSVRPPTTSCLRELEGARSKLFNRHLGVSTHRAAIRRGKI